MLWGCGDVGLWDRAREEAAKGNVRPCRVGAWMRGLVSGGPNWFGDEGPRGEQEDKPGATSIEDIARKAIELGYVSMPEPD